MAASVVGTLSAEQKQKLAQIEASNKYNKLKKSQEMGRDQFLKVLMTQLSHQNPLSPLEDKDFIAQMAQFTSVESMQEMVKGLDDVKDEIKAIKESLTDNKEDKEVKKDQSKAELFNDIAKAMQALDRAELEKLNDLMQQIRSKKAYQV